MFSVKPQEQDNLNNNNDNHPFSTSLSTISTIISPTPIISCGVVNNSTITNSTTSAVQSSQCSPTLSFSSTSTSSSSATSCAEASFAAAMLSTTTTTAASLAAAIAMDLQNGNANSRDRTHLCLDFSDLKPPQEPTDSGLSPISLPMSLLDSNTVLMSPERILLAAQQHHQSRQQLLLNQHPQQPKLETPTPSNFIFPKNVTTAQETFAEGFQKALLKIQGDTSLPTFQSNSPSTVKFLLSLAALTPTLSPSVPPTKNSTLLAQQIQRQAAQAVAAVAAENNAKRLEVPKIVLNNQPTAIVAPNSQNEAAAANDLAKRYMEYFQIGQMATSAATGANAAAAAASSSSADFIQQIPQFHPPAPVLQPQKPLTRNNFIKKEPPILFGNDQQEHQLLGDSPTTMMQLGAQLQMNGGGGGPSANNAAGGGPVGGGGMNGPGSSAGCRRKESMSSGSEHMGEVDIRKLERKRARNRLAASKCRQRKLQRISDLETLVAEERERGSELQEEIGRLQGVIKSLQEKLNQHNSIGGTAAMVVLANHHHEQLLLQQQQNNNRQNSESSNGTF